jgi:hypothetical protein
MFGMPLKLFITTALTATAVLFVVILLQLLFERIFRVTQLIPAEIREERNRLWFALLVVVEAAVYAVGPTLFYFWIYAVLPFFSYRAGVAVGLFLYFFGALPLATAMEMRMKMPGGVMIFTLFFSLLKLVACWATISYMLNR